MYEFDYFLVVDLMFCEFDQLFVVYFVEELIDVGIQYLVYVSVYQFCGQCVQCIVLVLFGFEFV